jgi:hypothetical protein
MSSKDFVLVSRADLRITVEMLQTMYGLLHQDQPAACCDKPPELVVRTEQGQERNITAHVPMVVRFLAGTLDQAPWTSFMEMMGEGWVDSDNAQYHLGRELGIFDDSEQDTMEAVRDVLQSLNPVGNALHHCLASLEEAGLLEYDSDRHRYRAAGEGAENG